jgi:hypothetical protein
MWEVHTIKIKCISHMLRDTCQSYVRIVWNFLQTDLYEIYVLNWYKLRSIKEVIVDCI